MPDSVLITGVSGFIGSNLALHCAGEGYKVFGTFHTRPSTLKGVETRKLDVCRPDLIAKVLEEAKPKFVFHLGAITDPDACAKDLPACRQINVQGSKLLAEACAKAGAKMVFTSTDLVFDGETHWVTEKDEARPLGAYGRSKLDAEAEVQKAEKAGACVVRTTLTYGWGRAQGRSFAENWLKNLLMSKALRCFTDQYRTPIYVLDLCQALLDAAEADLKGVYHAGGPDRMNRYDFGKRLAEEFQLSADLVQPASINDAVFLDPRPKDCSLNSDKLRSAVGFAPKPVAEGLKHMHEKLHTLR